MKIIYLVSEHDDVNFLYMMIDPAKNNFKMPKSAELKINSLHGWWPSKI
jgi:hypothetical protein